MSLGTAHVHPRPHAEHGHKGRAEGGTAVSGKAAPSAAPGRSCRGGTNARRPGWVASSSYRRRSYRVFVSAEVLACGRAKSLSSYAHTWSMSHCPGEPRWPSEGGPARTVMLQQSCPAPRPFNLPLLRLTQYRLPALITNTFISAPIATRRT